jgi:uncharacterized surface protein with fasciclin (FAS1) repeats
MKYIKTITMMTIAGATLASCSDWTDHYENGAGISDNASLWETLKADSRLSDFCDVLEQTKIFRHHRRTSVSYADLLNGGQAFTVFAPVNGTFNKDSLLQLVQTDQGDSTLRSFLCAITSPPRLLRPSTDLPR